MFDRTVVVAAPRPSTTYVDRHVTINRAPTDKSVELLREMEKAAQAKLDEATAIGGNGFECVVQKQRDLMSGGTCYRIMFDLNGARHCVTHTEEGWRSRSKAEIADTLVGLLADKIAREALAIAFGRGF